MTNKYLSVKSLFEEAQEFGTLESQSYSDWCGDIPLPDAIGEFYDEIGPKSCQIDTGFEMFDFVPLRDLWKLQASYRWNANTGERDECWLDNWIVLTESRLDPLIFNTESNTILFDRHSQGYWKPIQLFADINSMLLCICSMAKLLKDAGDDAYIEDGCVIHPDYIKQLQSIIYTQLGQEDGGKVIEAFEIREF